MKQELNIKQKRVMIYFITSAREMINAEGVENLTVRKVAMAAGYNSATLYNYFEDMEELVIFSSIGYLREYTGKLEKVLENQMDARQRYRRIYELFSEFCFGRPELSYGLFYGKYKSKLKNVISTYYELFPEELGNHDEEVLRMLTEGEIQERDKAIMPSLVKQKFVAEDNVEQTVKLITRMFQSYLYDAWMGSGDTSVEEQIREVLETFDYVMDKAV